MVQRVDIKWSNACRWDTQNATRTKPKVASSVGIYQLTRQWEGQPEELLYLGIVWSEARTMLKRMSEHRRSWLGTLRGIYYYFGTVIR